MKITQVRAAIRKAKEVYVYVQMDRDDGAYVRAYKNDIMDHMSGYFDGSHDIRAHVDVNGKYLYIG